MRRCCVCKERTDPWPRSGFSALNSVFIELNQPLVSAKVFQLKAAGETNLQQMELVEVLRG